MTKSSPHFSHIILSPEQIQTITILLEEYAFQGGNIRGIDSTIVSTLFDLFSQYPQVGLLIPQR